MNRLRKRPTFRRWVGCGVLLWILCATTPRTATAQSTCCGGDCNGDGNVTVSDLLVLVNIALGNQQADACLCAPECGAIEVACLPMIIAVRHALEGCPASIQGAVFPQRPDSSSCCQPIAPFSFSAAMSSQV